MRITLISQLPPPLHGSTMMTRRLVESLQRQGHQVTIVDRRFSTDVVSIGKFSIRKVIAGFGLPMRLAAAILRERPNLVVFFITNRSFSFLVDCVLAALLKLLRRRTVFYVHTLGYRQLSNRGPMWRCLVKRLLQSPGRLVALSSLLIQDLRSSGATAEISVIPNTAGKPTLTQPSSNAERYVLYFSNLIPEKGILDFIEMGKKVRRHRSDVHFVIAGATHMLGFQNRLIQEIRNCPQGWFEMVGAVTDERRKWELIQGAHMLIFPSTYPYEAQPLTVLESLASGTPVIAYDVGAVSEVIRNGVDGYVVPPKHVDETVNLMHRILDDNKLRSKLSRSASDRYATNFSEDVFDQNWQAIIRSDTPRR